MSYPFDTTFYDLLYTNVSTVLKTQFPQQENETIRQWYKRMLYEYVTYLQAKYEAETNEEKINPGKKPNKKKDNPSTTNFVPPNVTIFDTNTENALDVVSMDSNFAIYLFIEWFPLLIEDGDWVRVCVNIDQSDTAGHNVPFSSIEFEFEQTTLKILGINGVRLNNMKESYFDQLKLDSFLKAILKIISFYSKGSTVYDYDTISDVAIVNLSPTDYITNGFKIGEILWKIKDITQPLFVNEIKITSNLIMENNGVLSVSKGKSEKSQRKKFNSRKFLKSTIVSDEEKASNIIQTLMIAIFRTYYDFDPDNIDQNLFDYLFYGTALNL